MLLTFDLAGMRANRLSLALYAAALLGATAHAAGADFPPALQGDLGLGAYYTRSIVRGVQDSISVLPYGDFEYGRMFARVDTLGIKTAQLGRGYLELVGRVSMDGFSTDTPALRGLKNRETSIPLGIGTLQVTPVGGFLVNYFHDVRQSKGDWAEAIYGGEFGAFGATFYPLLGAEYQSREYVRYYYGVSAQEAAASQYAAYEPAGAVNGLAGLIADIGLGGGYHLNCYVRRKWLGDAIRSSPIVSRSYLDTGYLALSYRFK